MAAQDLPIVGDSFALGYRFQRHWDTSMANAFFFGELGAAVFLVSMLCGFVPGMLGGLVITGTLKTFFHITHMGVPGKSWRAIVRPDRSWVSRGLLGIVCLMGFGGLSTLVAWTGALAPDSPLTMLLKLAAGAAALVVMTYQGLAMSHSTAISLWNTGLMPVASLVYSATGGTLLTLLGGWSTFAAAENGERPMLANVALLLVVVIAVVVASLLHGAHHGSPGGRKSVEVLTRTYYAKWFWGCICVLGIVLPAVLLSVAGGNCGAVVVATAGVLIGHYAFRVLMFKAGVYEPIMNFRF